MNEKEYIKKLGFMIDLNKTLIKGFLIEVVITSIYKGIFDLHLFKGENFVSTENSLENVYATSSFGKIIRYDSPEGLKSL